MDGWMYTTGVTQVSYRGSFFRCVLSQTCLHWLLDGFMDRISRQSQEAEDHLFLLLVWSFIRRWPLALTGVVCSVKCEAPRMKISSSKSETIVLSWKKVECPLWVGN